MSRKKSSGKNARSKSEKKSGGRKAAPAVEAQSERVIVRRSAADGKETRGVAPASSQATGEARFAKFHDLLGKVADSEIAALAGVSEEDVESARVRRGLSAAAPPAAKRGRGRPRKGAEVRKPAVPASRAGKLDAFRQFIGVKSDAEVAAMANITVSGVRKWRSRHGVASAGAGSSTPAKKPRGARVAGARVAPAAGKVASRATGRSKLEDFVHLMGVESDARIAELAGITVSGVRKYRSRRAGTVPAVVAVVAAPAAKRGPGRPRKNAAPIVAAAAPAAPAAKRGRGRPRKNAAPIVAAAAPAAPAAKRGPGRPRKNPLPAVVASAPVVKRGRGRPRKNPLAPAASTAPKARKASAARGSKLDNHRDIVGVLFDSEVAKITGMTGEGVRQYRKRHKLEAGNLRELPSPSATAAPVVKAATAAVAKAAPKAAAVQAAAAQVKAAPAAKAEPKAAPSSGPLYAFSVEAQRGTATQRFVVTGSNVGDAAVKAVECCARRSDGPWTVRALQQLDELLT